MANNFNVIRIFGARELKKHRSFFLCKVLRVSLHSVDIRPLEVREPLAFASDHGPVRNQGANHV